MIQLATVIGLNFCAPISPIFGNCCICGRVIVAYQLPHHTPSVVGHSERTVRDLWVSLRQVSLPMFIYPLTTFQTCKEILGANFRAHLSDFLLVLTLVYMAF